MAGTKQKRIDELEELLREAQPIIWVVDREANAALKWIEKRDKVLKEGDGQ